MVDDIKKIKLLILVPSLACGGMEKYTSLLCNTINTNIFDVTLAVLDNTQPFFTITNPAVRVLDLKTPQVRYSIFKVLRVIKNLQPDIVYCTGNHLNLYLAIFRNFISRKIVVLARETSIVSLNNKRATMPRLYDMLVKRFYRKLDFIISQSHYMEQDLLTHYNIKPGQSAVIYNPVEQPALPVLQNNTGTTPFQLVTVARLSEEKGIDRLIAAVAQCSIPFRYTIFGEGHLRPALQQQINSLQLQDKVFLQGRINNPFDEIKNTRLFLMGSRYEGLGNVLLEATIRAIPVVAYNSPGGINEIITDGENGYLVPDNDIAAFAKAVEKAAATNLNRQQIAAAAAKKFALTPIVNATEQLLLQLYKNKR